MKSNWRNYIQTVFDKVTKCPEAYKRSVKGDIQPLGRQWHKKPGVCAPRLLSVIIVCVQMSWFQASETPCNDLPVRVGDGCSKTMNNINSHLPPYAGLNFLFDPLLLAVDEVLRIVFQRPQSIVTWRASITSTIHTHFGGHCQRVCRYDWW